ncbi:MAG: hypothetical protein OXC14_07755 [Rhodospirillaceae bacterium]|nr:hypothetical protein [Rhodospirillaceae bacterium]
MLLKKAGSNWVAGDQFFDRERDLEFLTERFEERAHTLLTAQRRMGKTSLVRELLRRLDEKENFETIFVDLQDAETPADAIAEIAARSRSVQGAWFRIQSVFDNVLQGIADRVDTVGVGDLRASLRAGMDAGNWQGKGDALYAALAQNDRPVVLALDELSILVNRLLKDSDYRITAQGKKAADLFLSWLRKNGQEHRDRVCLIISGSVSLEPILRQAGLSSHANIFSPFHLKPWDEKTADRCLAELAQTYRLVLSPAVRKEMCRRLRCQIPHHVQLFFDNLDQYLRHRGRRRANLDDVKHVYEHVMLGPWGQPDLDHYETRLKMVLGIEGCRIALDLLTEAAVHDGRLLGDAIRRFKEIRPATGMLGEISVEDTLRVLEHDGYLEVRENEYRFVSRLVEDWWRARHQKGFIPILERET